jgi:hypothetical protein
MRFVLQSGFEPMVVRMINLTTKLVYVVRECVAEHSPFFVTQRECHRALSSIERRPYIARVDPTSDAAGEQRPSWSRLSGNVTMTLAEG